MVTVHTVAPATGPNRIIIIIIIRRRRRRSAADLVTLKFHAKKHPPSAISQNPARPSAKSP
jgi:hypothetical protein